MARLARYVLPGVPHHVTQRGNGRQQTFFKEADYAAYRDLLATHCAAHGVAVWSWVLMPNHVHMILVPDHVDALRAALSKVHRAYAGRIHAREQRTGHFWQGPPVMVGAPDRVMPVANVSAMVNAAVVALLAIVIVML